MTNRQLSTVLIGLIACLAGGFLYLLVRAAPGVDVRMRVTDVAAETAAGTLSLTNGVATASPKEVEKVNIEGTFETFGGTPGATVADWPRFRGADFSNIVAEGAALTETWATEGPPVVWSLKLGEGHAGAAVWKGRVFVMDYDEDREGDALRCFSFADGKEIWRRWYKAPTKRNHGVSRTVPAITDRHIVAIGPRCHVLCVDTESGSFRWGIDLVAEHGAEVPLWYTGQCPLIDDGVAVLAPGGPKALMMGVDCETGKVVWQTPNPDGWKMSHSSIIPMTLLGRKMYVYCAKGGLVGVSAEAADRGTVLWKTAVWNHSVMSPSPVAIDDHRLFLTAGYGGGSMMMEIKPAGGGGPGAKYEAQPLFNLDKTIFACEQQTPLYHRGHLFGVLPKDAGERRGQFACLDPTGKLVWTSGKTERFGLGPFLMADDKVFILNDNGELTLIRASLTGYEQVARARVLKGHDAWAPMALVDGRLLLRDCERMICLDVRRL